MFLNQILFKRHSNKTALHESRVSTLSNNNVRLAGLVQGPRQSSRYVPSKARSFDEARIPPGLIKEDPNQEGAVEPFAGDHMLTTLPILAWPHSSFPRSNYASSPWVSFPGPGLKMFVFWQEWQMLSFCRIIFIFLLVNSAVNHFRLLHLDSLFLRISMYHNYLCLLINSFWNISMVSRRNNKSQYLFKWVLVFLLICMCGYKSTVSKKRSY